jgi:hypothetical protein
MPQCGPEIIRLETMPARKRLIPAFDSTIEKLRYVVKGACKISHVRVEYFSF